MEEQNIRLQQEVKQCVHSIGRWYKFFAIVGIVGASLMLLLGALMIVASAVPIEAFADYPFPAWVLGAVYLISAGLELPVIIYLWRAAKYARKAVGFNNNEEVTRFVRYTKRYWKYYGILTIVLLGLCALAVPTGVAAALIAAM